MPMGVQRTGTMCAASSSFRRHLLRAVTTTRKGYATVGNGFAPTAAATPFDKLAEAVKFERDSGLRNFKGKVTFSERLVFSLQELASSRQLPEGQRQAFVSLVPLAQQYPAMDVGQRDALLEQVAATADLQLNTGTEPPTQPSRAASQQTSRQDRADRYAHLVAHQQQQQAAWRGHRQQQQQQQQAALPATPPQSHHAQLPPTYTNGHARQQQQVKPLQQQPSREPAHHAPHQRPGSLAQQQVQSPISATSSPSLAATPRSGAATLEASCATPPSMPFGSGSMHAEQGGEVGAAAAWPGPAEYQPPMAWTQVVPILFDLETTGLNKSEDWIVEIAAKNLVTQRWFTSQARLQPGEEMSRGAEITTGLTTRALRMSTLPERRVVMHNFGEWLKEQMDAAAPEAILVLIGHNIVEFDCKFLVRNLQWAGVPALPHARLLDTLTLAARLRALGRLKSVSLKLEKLAEHYLGGPVLQEHRAEADVEINELVLQHLRRDLQEEGTPWELLLANNQHSSAFAPGDRSWLGQIEWRNNSQTAARVRGKASPSPPAVQAPAAKPNKLAAAFSLAADGQGQGPGPGAGLGSTLQPSGPFVLGSAPGGVAADGAVATGGMAAGFQWEDEDEAIGGVDPLIQLEGAEGATEAPSFDEQAASRAAWARLLSGGVSAAPLSFLDTPLEQFKSGEHKFTPKQREKLAGVGMSTLLDLAELYPKAHRSAVPGQLPGDEEEEGAVCLPVKLAGKITEGRANMHYLGATLRVVPPHELGLSTPDHAQQAASCTLNWARFSPYPLSTVRRKLQSELAEGAVVYGRVKRKAGSTGPAWEFLDNGDIDILAPEEAQALFVVGRPMFEPVYAQAGQLKGKDLEKHVGTALAILEAYGDRWQDPLPARIREEYGLVGYLEARKGILQPESMEQLEACRRRIAFEELLTLQLKLLLKRHLFRLPDREEQMEGVHIRDYSLCHRAIASLTYQLTGGQQRALEQLQLEMGQWPPMMCLLQGDVGCGKTIVAFLALLAAAGSGYQGVIMAPTEILAEQHYANIRRLLDGMEAAAAGEGGTGGPPMPTAALLTGSVTGKDRTRIYSALRDGSINIAVGTHALLNKDLEFRRLGLAVVDEQHRFGVAQRSRLRDKSCPSPHILYMTATPIPRTSALVLHGDMSQVVIDEMPPGRTRVATHALLDSETARQQVYAHMQQEIGEGGQVYIICPLVEESTAEGLGELKAATQERARLVEEGIFSEEQCGLLHGQLKSSEKEAALRAFASGRTPVLISTTVVEVGVDVPAATLMLVEHADRFGLAQLHQLRGRVGRGPRASTCYLVADKQNNMERLRVMEQHHSGFHVAEADLWIRGPGEVLGTTQSGRENFSALKMCKLPRDRDLVPRARDAAAKYLAVHTNPSTWHASLLSVVFASGMPQLDITELPNAAE